MKNISIIVLATVVVLTAGCGVNEQGLPTPDDYGMSSADVAKINTNAAPGVETVKQKLSTIYPSGETPSCPLVNGAYEIPPPGNIQMRDTGGWCWRIYCPTGTPDIFQAPNDGGVHLPNLTNQWMGGIDWNNRITMIEQGPGTFVWWFDRAYDDSPQYHARGSLPWTGWEWKEWHFPGNITSMACGRNY
jgi:hypothetical protein